jgi:hypothetical protein
MLNFFASLFTPHTVEKAVDGVYNGLDKLFFTDEEKSEASQKILDWRLKWMEATAPQNVSRRFIAIVVTLLWAFLILVMLAAKAFHADAYASYAYDVMVNVVGTPFSIILGFYFLAQVASRFGGGGASAEK